MASTEKQVVKTLAEEIARAINKKSGGNALSASLALTAKTAQSLSGTINASQIIGNMNASQIAGLNGAIAGVLIGLPSSTNPDDIEIKAVISDLAALEVKNAVIETAQIQDLYASYGEFIRLVAEEGKFDEVYADLAKITHLEAKNADIDFAKIKDLTTDTALIREGVGGKLYIDRLAVTEAQILDLAVGNLMIQGEDGNLYHVYIDENGEIKTELRPIAGSDIADKTIDGTNIMDASITNALIHDGAVTARTLNASEIFGNKAIIIELTSSDIFTSELTANSAFISKIATNTIGNYVDGEDPNAVQTAIMNLSDKRIEFTVGSEEEAVDGEGNSYSKLVLTDKMIRAISDRIKIEASSIDLSANDTISISASQIKEYHLGPLAPQDPFDGMLWLDTDAVPNVWSKYDAATDTWVAAECSFVDSVLEGAVAKVFNAEFDIDGTNGTIKSLARSIEANESGLTDLKESVELITPEYIVTTVTDSDDFSMVKQEADKIEWIITDGSSESSLTFTQTALDAIADDINLTANHTMTFNADQLKQIANDIDLSANNTITIDAEKINAVADQIDLSSNKTITLTSEHMDLIAKSIDLEANDNFTILVGKVEDAEESMIKTFVQDDPPAPPYNVGDLWHKNTDSDLMVCVTTRTSGEYVESDWAVSTDTTARSDAESAGTAASDAQNMAEAAFNNYKDAVTKDDFKRLIRVEIDGLHVGDNTTNSEMVIDSGSINAVVNGETYSSFGANFLQLGDDIQIRTSTDAGGIIFAPIVRG